MIFKTTDDGKRIISFFNKAKIESENFTKQLEKDKIFLTEYFNATGDVAKQQAILNKSTNEASKNAIEYAVSTKGAAGSVSNFEQQQIKTNASVQKSKKYFDLSTVSAGAYKLAIKGITIVANMATSALLSGVVYAFSKLFTAQNEAIEKAKELTSTYKSNNTSLENYKEQINTLVTELNTSNISYEKSKTKRKELMSIQDELFKKYGTEKEVIKSITAAINGEVNALDTLSQKSYYEWLASVDSLTDAQKFGNGFFKIFTGIPDQYKSALDSAVDYMEDKTQFFYVKTTGNEELDKLIQEKFNLYKNAFDEFVIKDMVPEEAYELLGQIRTAYRDNASEYLGTETDNILTTVNDSIQSAMTTIDAELAKHQETYHTYIEGMIKYDSEYSDEYADLLSKRALLEEAELSTNDEGKQQRILEAKKTFYDSLNNAITSAENNDNVKRYFENLYPDLYSEISSWNFEYSVSANTDGIADTAKEIGEKYTAADLLSMIDDESALITDNTFNSLIDKAIEYGICTDKSAKEVQKLIDLLVELGIVQDNVKDDTFNDKYSVSFSEAWDSSFTSENDSVKELGNTLLELAEQGRLTIDTFNEADSTEYFKNLGISADEAVLKINKLVDESAQLSFMSGQISAIAGALGTKQTDGFVNADTLSGFDVEIRGLKSWDQFQAVLGSTASSYEECQKAANALASEWVRSNNFLAQLTEGNKAYYETQLKAMGVENASEVIYDALSAKEALVLQEQILAAETEAATNNTNFSIAAFLNEAGATEIARACLFQLITAEQVFNNTDLSTAEKIEKLKELANAYGQTAIVARIANMEKAEQDGHIPIDYEKELAALQTDINNAVGNVQIDFNSIGGAASHAAGAGKSAAESYIEAFEEELSDLSQLRDNGVITEKEYLDSLRALYERYFANKLGYEKEYAKYQRQYLEGYKSLYESALSGISTLLGNQIDGYKDAKDAAVSSLTDEKDARLEVIDVQKEQLEAQKDLIDEQIEAKQKLIDDIQNEINAMKEANSERQRQLDLQKAQYELERMQHQRTILQYSEENGMQYVQNDEGLRTAKENVDNAKFEIEISNKEKNISLLEDEISLLEEQKDAIQNQMDLLDKQADQIESYYSKMISETEAYYDSLINNMERQKSKWEEIAEIENIARAYSDLEQVAGGMGYSVQDILSGNEQAFEDFKSRYIALLSDLNNNSSFSEGLSYATSGIAQDIDNLEASAATVSESTGKIAANIGEVNTSAETLSGSLSNINDSLSGFSETDNITAAADAFSKLGQAIQSVADALNISEDGTIGSLTDALKSLCEMPLFQTDDDKNGGILSKFQALKTAVTDVTNAISGGGSSASDNGDGGNSSSPGTSSGAAGNSSGGLAGAIASLKSAATDALGGNGNDESEGQSEGSGIIAQFGQLKNAVTDTTEAIGSGDSKQKKKSKGNSKNGNLISSITSLGSTASEILTGDGNDEDKSGGVIGRFEQFKDVIGEANTHVTGIATGLHDIDGETVECTIKVNVEQNGELPAYSKGVLAPMKLESGEYKAKYGRTFAKGSGNYKGLPKSEKNALRSEYGQPELTVYPDGTTELTTQPTISDLPKGTVIFNEAQTKEIFQNKGDALGGVSSSNSTGQSSPGKPTLPPPQRPAFLVQQELQEECLAKTGSLTDKILSPLNMLSHNWKDMAGLTGNINHISHNGQNQSVNVGGINITCPGVTSQEVARQLGTELNHIFSGFHNYADQQSRVR